MKKIILFSTCFIFMMNSCDTNELEVSNTSAIATSTFPANFAELQSAINGVYSPLQAQGLYGRYLFYMLDYMGDDTDAGSRGTPDLRAFIDFSFTPTNNDIYLYWKNCYNGISRANFILDKEDNINALPDSDVSPENKAKFLSEAKFLRAYYYFLLVERFGDIPLYTTTEVSPNGLKKSPKEDVYQLIIADLTDAASKLFPKSTAEPGRATSGAANALLGKVRLYRKEYSEAKTAFDKVISSSEYSLTAAYFDNFDNAGENNSESVFEIRFTYENGSQWTYSDWDGQDNGITELTFRSAEYGGLGGFHNNDPAQDLLDEFEAGDSRSADSFFFLGDAWGVGGANTVTVDHIATSSSTALWRKYSLTYGQTNNDYNGLSDINHRALRYADVLLMAAEVENELGNTSAAVALMNQVRDRVGMPNYGTVAMDAIYPVSSQSEVFTAIIHERRVELAGEQSRFPDLLRWGMTSLIPDFVSGTHEVLPIPQRELDTNILLSGADQNPGY